MVGPVQERLEVAGVGDVVGPQQVREDRGGRTSIGSGLVGPGERDVVPLAEVAETVRSESIGVEAARHAQGTETPFEPSQLRWSELAPPSGVDEELAVEAGVVGDEQRITDP